VIVRPLALILPKRPRAYRPAAQRSRSSRSAVLWGIAAVVVANLGLAAAVETVLPQVRDPEYGYRLVRMREQRRLHPDRPLVLVMGTSRTANGIDPGAAGFPDEPGAPLLFNFGLSGASPIHMRTSLARLRRDGVKPDAVLVELLPVALIVEMSADALCARTASQLTAADLRQLEPQLADPAALGRAWWAARLDPWQAHRIVITSHLEPSLLPWNERVDHYWRHTDRFGFDAYPTNKTDEQRPRRLEHARKGYEKWARGTEISPTTDRAIRGLVADCRATGTPIAFFLTPESPTFRSWYTAESRAALATYLRALSAELDCPVFGAPEDYAEGDFADGHHMLPHAAARFTRQLAAAHLRPWFAEARK
jgi:hypothetical protein